MHHRTFFGSKVIPEQRPEGQRCLCLKSGCPSAPCSDILSVWKLLAEWEFELYHMMRSVILVLSIQKPLFIIFWPTHSHSSPECGLHLNINALFMNTRRRLSIVDFDHDFSLIPLLCTAVGWSFFFTNDHQLSKWSSPLKDVTFLWDILENIQNKTKNLHYLSLNTPKVR